MRKTNKLVAAVTGELLNIDRRKENAVTIFNVDPSASLSRQLCRTLSQLDQSKRSELPDTMGSNKQSRSTDRPLKHQRLHP
jgi:hypothetical protein